MLWWFCFLVFVFALKEVAVDSTAGGHPYDLPPLPSREAMNAAAPGLSDSPPFATAVGTLSTLTNGTGSATTIPKMFWVTMKHIHKHPNIAHVSTEHAQWAMNIVDDVQMNRFFETVYANTSVLWAYKMLNPVLGAAKADLFRYAVLYCFGGAYFDADTSFTGNLDQYLKPTDKFVWGSEGNPMGDCYQPWYPLSKTASFNEDRSILQWMLISVPEHVFMGRALVNAVDVIRRMYLKQEILSKAASPPEGKPFMQLMCSTGPVLFSTTVRQVVQEHKNNLDTLGHRFGGIDFKDIGGQFKAPGFKEDSNHHYSTQMNTRGAMLLHSYVS
jgi:hypothetical protein